MSVPGFKVLEELERLSCLMLEKARSAEWKQVEELERARTKWVRIKLSDPSSNAESLRLAAALKRVIELDKQLMILVRSRRAELLDELGYLRHRQKANRAYQIQIPDQVEGK